MAQNEIQTLTLYGSPTGGTCDLIFDGQTAAGIAYNAAASAVESALEALSNIGAGNVSCSGGPWPGSTITCEFVSSLAETALPEIAIDPSGLTGGTITASVSQDTAGSPDLDTGLVGYWPLNETTGVRYDSKGSTDLDRAFGSTVYPSSVSGKQSNAARFTGSAQYLSNLTPASDLQYNDHDLTVSCWVRIVDNISNSFYIARSYISSFQQPWALLYSGSSQRFSFASSGGALAVANSFGAPSLNTWYHVTATWDVSSKTATIRVNDGPSDSDTGTGLPISSGGAHFYVYSVTGTTDEVNLDELAVWNIVLSDAQIEALYNSGTGTAYPLSSGDNEIHTLTLNGSPSTGTVTLVYDSSAVEIDYNSSADSAETAIEAVFGAGNVSVTGGDLPGTDLDIEYTGDYVSLSVDVPAILYEGLLYATSTTQDGAPTPSQASAAWSSNTLTSHITGCSATWSSGDVTASGNADQATAEWSGSDLQATGIVNSSLPTATWSTASVSSAVLTGASTAWSSGTAILPGVFSAPAQANWKTLQFAVLPNYPVMAYWKTKSVTSDHNPLNVPTATWSSGNAQPAPALTGTPAASWSTTEVTLELTSVPVTAAWSTGSSTLSPALIQPSATWTSKAIIVPLFKDSAYIGMVTHRIIDSDLLVLTFTDGTITQPVGSNGTITSPGGFSGTLTSPEGVSGTFA